MWRKHQLPNCSKLSNPPQVFLAINGLATMPIPVKFNGYILTCDQVRFRPAKTKKRWKPQKLCRLHVEINSKIILPKTRPPLFSCLHPSRESSPPPSQPPPRLSPWVLPLNQPPEGRILGVAENPRELVKGILYKWVIYVVNYIELYIHLIYIYILYILNYYIIYIYLYLYTYILLCIYMHMMMMCTFFLPRYTSRMLHGKAGWCSEWMLLNIPYIGAYPYQKFIIQNWDVAWTKIKCLSGLWYTYPSEKWWSSSVGIMTFPTEWKVIKFRIQSPPTSHHKPIKPPLNHH